ncbi:9844_t:CDS:1 [Scutellospora calospora]|uniref:9844_t:CDS:1 n=1 Tax=Scutellospora calospora TaxID=85575 RepID=A0ACA9LEH5_9GLOM|nr:9844_t:CDS:1 [Scutellospora calospora]
MGDQASNIGISIPQIESSLKRLQKVKKLLKEYLHDDVTRSDYEVSNLLDEVRETKIWQHAGYESFYKFCQDIIGQDIVNVTNTFKFVKQSVYADSNAKHEIRILKLKRKMRELELSEGIIDKITEYPRDALHLVIRFFNRYSNHERLSILVHNLDCQINLRRSFKYKIRSKTNRPINKGDVKAAISMVERMESRQALKNMNQKEKPRKESDSDETIREEMDDYFTDSAELEIIDETTEKDECDWCDLIGVDILKCGQCVSGRCVECTMKEISKDPNNLAIVDKFYWSMLRRHAKESAEKILKK